MLRTIVHRAISMIPLLLIVTAVTFALASLVPVDPVEIRLGDDPDPAAAQAIRGELGLDDGLVQQYVSWLSDAVRGDFGTSYYSSASVTDAIVDRLPPTLSLTLGAALVAIVLGVGAGVIAGLRPGGIIDRVATVAASIGLATPNFFFAIVLVAVFALHWSVFPATGYTPSTESPWEWARGLALPCFALGTAASAALARQTRSAMVDTMRAPFVTAARARGVPSRRVVIHHGLRNASVPVLTVLGFQIAGLLGGSLIVEQVFAIAGLGSLSLQAVQQQDVPLLLGFVVFSALVIVSVNLLIDLAYAWLNPRVRPQ